MIKVLLLVFSFIVTSFASPSWYYKLPISDSSKYIGYGSSTSEAEAKQNALKSISSQILVKIDTKTKIDKRFVEGDYKKDIIESSTQETKSQLSDYKILKLEYIDGLYYIAIEYENIPTFDKLVNKINKAQIQKETILNSIKKDFAKSLGFELVRKDQNWYLKYENIMQVLSNEDLSKFFTTRENPLFSVRINKPHKYLYDGDEFFFEIKSQKSAYMTILTVYENGIVSTMMSNIKIKENRVENLPDKDFEAVPEAGLLKSGVETYDMYIFILSDEKLNLDSFAQAGDEVISDDRYKNFDELVRFLSKKTYSTLKVVTKPR